MTTELTFEQWFAAHFTPEQEDQARDAWHALQDSLPTPPVKSRKYVALSKPNRWEEAVGNADGALQELLDLQSEYSDILDNAPDNLRDSAYYQKMQEIVDLDIETVQGEVQDFSGVDLPLGFGRD